ncbi:MAG: protein tyrosine phosphatase family protein [Leptolyngbyaceae cyanobacterium bins.59]|nr:protein tyrosine phosphatase family protein [Leptolyngbyaceae cyanobacterium bins.59]
MAFLTDIRSFLQLSETIATAGQPTESEFALIRAAGYEVVVNLALPSSNHALSNEQEIVESQGMTYLHLPVMWETPTLEDLEQFFSILDSNSPKNMFIHCALNMRVSTFMYLYRVLRGGVDEVDARVDMERIWTPNPIWQAFIDRAMQHYTHS